MLSSKDIFPTFSGKAVMSKDSAIKDLDNSYIKGSWAVIFCWPMDFTFVCPTEIIAFNELTDAFSSCKAKILGFSVDSEYVHLAWKKYNRELMNLRFPMYSDRSKELTLQLGVLDRDLKVSQRATFVVDPKGIIQAAMTSPISAGRSAREALRLLQASQEAAQGKMTPCDWHKGSPTL